MSGALQPRLADALVRLDPLTESDREPLFAAAADPLIWAVHPARDRWRRPVFDAFFDESLASGGGLAARDPATGAVIGHSRYDRGRVGPEELEIGWTFLTREHWGGTTNAAMKRLMIGHALDHFARAVFLVGEDNHRSRRALEKIGAVLTDRAFEAEMGGRSVRHVIYAVDRPGFETGPLRS